jgi:hypothetical protein
MPPQPLSSKRKIGAHVSLDPIALRKNAPAAAKVAHAIALWARIESTLGTILARMLGGEARPLIAMYEAIRNSQTQIDVLEAAAKVALSPDALELFGALMVLVKQAGKIRHRFAHWLWGESPEFPDDLLLVEPSTMRENDKDMSDLIAAIQRGEPIEKMPPLDFTSIFVWEPRHFDEAVGELSDVLILTLRFASFLTGGGKGPVADQLSSQLRAEPRIQEALRRKDRSNPDAR